MLLQKKMSTGSSRFSSLENAPPIEVLEMCRAFREDSNVSAKVNLSVGGFEDDESHGGHDFEVVRKVEADLVKTEGLFHGYLPALVISFN